MSSLARTSLALLILTTSIADAGETTMKTAPFGSWASPISAQRLASNSIGLADLRVHAGVVYWRESRPNDGGRFR